MVGAEMWGLPPNICGHAVMGKVWESYHIWFGTFVIFAYLGNNHPN
jgi:hypothetical protein